MNNTNPNEKTIIIRHDEENDEIDLGRVFSIMFHNWKRLLCITVGVGVVGALGLKFIYNRPRINYVCDFEYAIPSYDGEKLVDGTKFTYSNLTDTSVLEFVKASNDKYASIDVEKISSGNKATIEEIKVYDEVNTTLVDSIYYELKIAQTCFSSAELAKSFFNDVINYPLTYNLSAQANLYYENNFDSYSSARTYEEMINCLQNQIDWLYNKYDSIISNYGDFIFTNQENAGKNVSAVERAIKDYFTNSPLSDLSSELSENGYIKSEYELNSLSYQKSEYERNLKSTVDEIDEIQAKIDALLEKTQGQTVQSLELDSYNTAITELTIQKTEYQTKIDAINRKIQVDGKTISKASEKPASSSFLSALNEDYQFLVEATDNLKKNSEPEAIAKYSKVNYHDASIITTSGGLSAIVTYAVPFAMGLVAAMITNFVCDHKYMNEPYPQKTKAKKV